MLASVGVAVVLALEDGSGLSVLNAALALGVFLLTGLVFAPLHGRVVVLLDELATGDLWWAGDERHARIGIEAVRRPRLDRGCARREA